MPDQSAPKTLTLTVAEADALSEALRIACGEFPFAPEVPTWDSLRDRIGSHADA